MRTAPARFPSPSPNVQVTVVGNQEPGNLELYPVQMLDEEKAKTSTSTTSDIAQAQA